MKSLSICLWWSRGTATADVNLRAYDGERLGILVVQQSCASHNELNLTIGMHCLHPFISNLVGFKSEGCGQSTGCQHSTACRGKDWPSVKRFQKTIPHSYRRSISWPSDTLKVTRSRFKQISSTGTSTAYEYITTIPEYLEATAESQKASVCMCVCTFECK